jgi:hypothetical protein
LGERFLEKMEIGESFFGKKDGKLAHLRNLAPKIIYGYCLTKVSCYFYQFCEVSFTCHPTIPTFSDNTP